MARIDSKNGNESIFYCYFLECILKDTLTAAKIVVFRPENSK